MVECVWDLSYLQGRNRRNMDLRPAWASWWICLKKKRKIFKLLAISIKMENPTPLCFPTECSQITCGLEGQWCQAREESDLKEDWVAVSSVSRCVLCHVLRGAGSWRSPWVWKKGAPKADLLVRGAGRGAPVRAGGFTCLFFCLFFLSPIPSVKSVTVVATVRESSQNLENTGPPSDC